MTTEESKLEILRKVENGTLSIEEGAKLLEILESGTTAQSKATTTPASEDQPVPADTGIGQASQPGVESVPAGWKALWSILLWLGIAFMGLTGYWLYSSYAHSGMGVGFWFALFFLILSCGVVWAGQQLISGRWLIVHVRENSYKGSRDFHFWAPLPLQLATWVFGTFGQYMPENIRARHYETIIQEMENSLDPDEPFRVEVEGEEGSKAHINMQFS